MESKFSNLILRKVSVRLPGIEGSFSPLRIAHLSDLHLSWMVRQCHVQRAVHLANMVQPHLIALTGDYVTKGGRFIEACAELLADLRAPLGVYAVLGNHDHWVDATAISSKLSRVGIKILQNTNEMIEGETKFWLAGIDDLWDGEPDLTSALQEIPIGEPTILLSHNPDAIYAVKDRPGCLVLSGHTHGGQIPWLGVRVVRGSRFALKHPSGLFQFGQAQIYITTGVGTTWLPLRILCPAEVALLEIHPTAEGEIEQG